VGEGAKTGVLSHETKCSKKLRAWRDLELMLITNCKIAKYINILQDAMVSKVDKDVNTCTDLIKLPPKH
jgi:hypothetical protein